MINIKSSFFYAALAASLGAGYGGHYLMSQPDRAPLDVRSIECEDIGKPKFDKTPRPLSNGKGF